MRRVRVEISNPTNKRVMLGLRIYWFPTVLNLIQPNTMPPILVHTPPNFGQTWIGLAWAWTNPTQFCSSSYTFL